MERGQFVRFLSDYGAQASKVKRVGLHQMEAWEEEIVGLRKKSILTAKCRSAEQHSLNMIS